MSIPCETLRLRLSFEAGHPRPWSAEVEEHVHACEACARVAERMTVLAGALAGLERRSAPDALADRASFAFDPLARGVRAARFVAGLPRKKAPEELEGWVVAASQAGSREDRAVCEVVGLPPLVAPRILDRLVRDQVPGSVRGPVRHAAPDDLEKRVAAELIRLPRAEVRRAASRIGRRQSRESEERLRAASPSVTAARRARAIVVLGFATAFAALLLAWSLGRDPAIGVRAAGTPLAPIASSGGAPEQLPAVARGLADGLTGGLWSLQGVLASASDEAAARQSAVTTTPTTGSASSTGAGARSATPTSGSSGSSSTISSSSRAPVTQPLSTQRGFVGTLAQTAAHIPFRGTRRVELFLTGPTPSLAYREEALADAQGNFAVEPLEVLAPAAGLIDHDLFLLLMKAREGFVHRHRDFRIRDEDRFLANYETVEVDADTLVAGRPCVELEVRRAGSAASGGWYRVQVDQDTGLVLAYAEYRADGSVLARVEYETFELDPDLTGFALSGTASAFVPIDLADVTQHPFPLTLPVAVPAGFELAEVGSVDLDTGPWVRFTYGDGVEQVFLLVGPPPAGQGGPVAGTAGASSASKEPDRLWHFEVGAWSVLQGTVGGREVAAFGKIHRLQLELLLQSGL